MQTYMTPNMSERQGIYDGDGNTGMCHEDTRKSFVRGIQCVSHFSM